MRPCLSVMRLSYSFFVATHSLHLLLLYQIAHSGGIDTNQAISDVSIGCAETDGAIGRFSPAPVMCAILEVASVSDNGFACRINRSGSTIWECSRRIVIRAD